MLRRSRNHPKSQEIVVWSRILICSPWQTIFAEDNYTLSWTAIPRSCRQCHTAKRPRAGAPTWNISRLWFREFALGGVWGNCPCQSHTVPGAPEWILAADLRAPCELSTSLSTISYQERFRPKSINEFWMKRSVILLSTPPKLLKALDLAFGNQRAARVPD